MVWSEQNVYPFTVYNNSGVAVLIIDDQGLRSIGSLYTTYLIDGEIVISPNLAGGSHLSMNPLQFAFDHPGFVSNYLESDANGIGFRTDTSPEGVYLSHSTGFLTKAIRAPWAEETWTAPALNVNFTALGEPPRYKLFPDGTVHLRGGVHYGGGGNPPDGTSAFTLPAGYRPTQNTLFPAAFWGTNTIGRLLITPAGQVQVFGAPATDYPLDVVQFSVI